MIEPWNNPNLLPPPVLTTPSQTNEVAESLLLACQQVHRVLSKQSPLHKEAAIVSRLIYKYDKKFRNDIGYRNLKKVNTALKKYLQLNFMKDLDNFQMVLPAEDADEDIYLPSRQMLEYLLTRLQSFSKIMFRISVCSKCAATFYLDRIKRGESHWMSLIPYAVLARIWSMSTVLIQHSCKWYKNFMIMYNRLKPKGLKLLPENYKLPDDLSVWLELDKIEEFGRHEWSEMKSISVIPALGDVEDQESNFDIFKYVNDINANNELETHTFDDNNIQTKQETEEQQTSIQLNKSEEETINIMEPIDINPNKDLSMLDLKRFDQKESKINKRYNKIETGNQDTGQAISRKSYTMQTESITKTYKMNLHLADNVTNSKDLKKFIKEEEGYRNENDSKSLSSHLSFMQWQALKSNLMELCESKSNNRKIQRRFLKLWKQKCLDYI